MSTSVSTAFVRQYESEVHHVFQREGGILRPTVRLKDNITGSSTTFQKIGKGTAVTKARHGTITPMNQDHTSPECVLADFYAGDWVDKLDEAKINHDERMAIARGGAMALGRKVDNQIITELDATTQSQKTIVVTSAAAVDSDILEWTRALWENDVPNDGRVFGVITPFLEACMQRVEAYNSSDYVDIRPAVDGPNIMRMRRWRGVNWAVHTGLPNFLAAGCKGFLYHMDAVGYGTGKSAGNAAQGNAVAADVTWHGDRAAWFVNHMMSGGAKLIDDSGVIEATWDDSTTIPST